MRRHLRRIGARLWRDLTRPRGDEVDDLVLL